MRKIDLDQIKQLPDDATLTAIEVARMLGMTAAGVIKKLKRGSIKGVQVAGKWYVLGKEMKAQVVSNESLSVTPKLTTHQ